MSSQGVLPLRPTDPHGHLFDGPRYRYTFVSPLLDDMAVARRAPLKTDGPEEFVLLKKRVSGVLLTPEEQATAGRRSARREQR